MESAFSKALHNKSAQGTLISDVAIRQASQMLLSSLIGMNILIRIKVSNEAAQPTASGLRTIIISWRKPA
jgi:hypothetical protein